MNYKDIGYYFHFLIPLGLILMPLLPIQYLKYAVFLPPALYLLWIVCNGCPLTHSTQGDKENFIEGILKKLHPNLADKTDQIIGLILTLVLALISYKAINQIKIKRK